LAGKFLDNPQNGRVAEGQGIENHFSKNEWIFGCVEAVFLQLLRNRLQHTGWVQGSRIVRKDQPWTLLHQRKMLEHALIVDVRVSLLPLAPAGLQNPEAHHILQEPDRPKGATFICKVVTLDVWINQRMLPFDTDERPGA